MSEPVSLHSILSSTLDSSAAGPVRKRGSRAPAPVARPANPPVHLTVAPADWSHWYLTDEDDVGQSLEHWLIVDLLVHLCKELAKERGWDSVLVGCDQFIAWNPEHELARVSPDVYITDNPPVARPSSWKTWLPGQQAPRFAVEVVSSDWRKDYKENPLKYASMGVRELVLADPYAFLQPDKARSAQRVPLQVYRLGPDGLPDRVAAGPGPVYCTEIDAYLLFCTDSDGEAWVRISRDAAGRDRVSAPDEQARAAKAERDQVAAELGAAEAELGAAEAKLGAALELLRKHGLA